MKAASVALAIGVSALGVACCAVSASGIPVKFVGQTNIVVWDEKHGLEHFVRDARFDTRGKDLGFLAPTPSQPTLSEVDGAAFDTLAALKPEEPVAAASADGTVARAAAGGVKVVAEQDVAGYHASILKATDAKGLGDWLKSNGYPTPKFLEGWVKPYLEKGWYLTAFKVEGGHGASTGPLRMSFKTARAFNPYSVPEENGGGDASLKIYYVSAGKEVPRVGGTGSWKAASWTAEIPAATGAVLAKQLKLDTDAIPEGATVTAYDDWDFGRPGQDDLYFVSNDGRAGLAFMAGVAAIAGVAVARRRQRRLSASS